MKRKCEWCKKDISDKQTTARFCGKLHKSNAWNHTFKGKNYRKKYGKKYRRKHPDYWKKYFTKFGGFLRYCKKIHPKGFDYYRQKK